MEVIINKEFRGEIIKICEPYIEGIFIPQKVMNSYDENNPEELPELKWDKMYVRVEGLLKDKITSIEIIDMNYEDEDVKYKYEYEKGLELIKVELKGDHTILEVI